MQRTQKFSDFLAVINFIHNPDMVSTHVGEVIVREEGNTFLHEVLHAGMEISGLSTDGGPLKSHKQEELTVNALTNLLTQVIRDNKWFLPYLFGAINGAINGKRSRSKALAATQKRFKKLTLSTNRKQNRSRRSGR